MSGERFTGSDGAAPTGRRCGPAEGPGWNVPPHLLRWLGTLAAFREPALAAGTALLVGLILALAVSAVATAYLDPDQLLAELGTDRSPFNPLITYALSHLGPFRAGTGGVVLGVEVPSVRILVRPGFLCLVLLPLVSLLAGSAVFSRAFEARTGLGPIGFAARTALVYAGLSTVVILSANASLAGLLRQLPVFAGFSVPGTFLMTLLWGFLFSLPGWRLAQAGPLGAPGGRYAPYLRAVAAGSTALALEFAFLLAVGLVAVPLVIAGSSSAVPPAAGLAAVPNLAAYALAYIHGSPVHAASNLPELEGRVAASLAGGVEGVPPFGSVHYLLLLVPLTTLLLGGYTLDRRRPALGLGRLGAAAFFGLGYGLAGAAVVNAAQVSVLARGATEMLNTLGTLVYGETVGLSVGCPVPLTWLLLTASGALFGLTGAAFNRTKVAPGEAAPTARASSGRRFGALVLTLSVAAAVAGYIALKPVVAPGRRLVENQAVAGELTESRPAHLYRFAAVEGRLYIVETRRLSPECDTVLSLYDRPVPVGRRLARSDDVDELYGHASMACWMATRSGTVYVEVAAYSDHYGTYEVLLSVPPRGGGRSPEEAEALVVDGLGVVGTLEPGRTGWFTFKARAGTTYYVVTDCLEGDTVITLFSGSPESPVAGDDDAGPGPGSLVEYTADADEDLFVCVGQHPHHEGETVYRLRVLTTHPGN